VREEPDDTAIEELKKTKETPVLEPKGSTLQPTQQNSYVQKPAAASEEESKEDPGKAGKLKATKQPAASSQAKG